MNYFNFTLVVILFFNCQLSFSQTPLIKISSKFNDNKTVDLVFEKEDAGTVTVEIKFEELSNTSVNGKQYTAKGFGGNLLTLRPLKKDEEMRYSYSYRSIRGKLLPKIDRSFIYLLPYAADTKVRVSEASFMNATYFGNSEPNDWKVYYFYTDNPAIVTASRKGLVVEVNDTFEDSELQDKYYSSKTNCVLVEHADGSLLEYNGLQYGDIRVKVGEYVFPGQEIGVNVKRSDGKYAMVFSLYYLKKGDLSVNENKNLTNSESFYGWINPIFRTVAGTQQLQNNQYYSALIDEGLVVQEMTKKELKKYKTQ